MIDNRTASAIDQALQKHDTPVGPLFFVTRHGRTKKCLTRKTAIRYLAFFMTTRAFEHSGFRQRYPDKRFIFNRNEIWKRGESTTEYTRAHQRTIRRLRRLIARKQYTEKWFRKYDTWSAGYYELMATKPF